MIKSSIDIFPPWTCGTDNLARRQARSLGLTPIRPEPFDCAQDRRSASAPPFILSVASAKSKDERAA